MDTMANTNGQNSFNSQNSISMRPPELQNDKKYVQYLRDLEKDTVGLEHKLREANMIKGHANNIQKLQNDIANRIKLLTTSASHGCLKT